MAAKNKIESVNRWLTLGANLGVVLGLIILIIEVQQNAALTRAALEADKNNQLANIELSLASPATAAAWTKSVRTPETMTDTEIRIVESHMVAVMLQWDNLFQMESNGLTTMARVERHIRNTAPFYFGSRFGKNWWKRQMLGWEGTLMFDIADPIILSVDSDFIVTYLDQNRLRAPKTTGKE